MEILSTHKEDRRSEVVIFGFGAQGRAHALNLKDNGIKIAVHLRPDSEKIKDAVESGIPLITDPIEAAKRAHSALMALPDSSQPVFYRDYMHDNLPKGAAIIFAHGLSIHYKLMKPRSDLDVILVAPLAHGNAVRGDFVNGGGVPCMIAVAQDGTGGASRRAHDYAKAISKTGPFIETTFAEEVETDLFVEQVLLCGGLPELVRAAFETLTRAGYNADAAYFSCLKELRPIVELLDRHSIAGLRKRISDTACFGAITRGPRVIDDHTKKEMDKILSEIRSGQFIGEFLNEGKDGHAISKAGIARDSEHAIEKIHRRYNPHSG